MTHKPTKGVEDFKKHINAPTKKDPRLDPATDHEKAWEETKGKGPKLRPKIQKKIKF